MALLLLTPGTCVLVLVLTLSASLPCGDAFEYLGQPRLAISGMARLDWLFSICLYHYITLMSIEASGTPWCHLDKSPARMRSHSREGGNPRGTVKSWNRGRKSSSVRWIPACAGMTPSTNSRITTIDMDSRLRGNDCARGVERQMLPKFAGGAYIKQEHFCCARFDACGLSFENSTFKLRPSTAPTFPNAS